MKIYLYTLNFCFLLISEVYASCTPAPDCETLGYTALSCPKGGVKCPFDTTKWHCDKTCRDFGFNKTCKGNFDAAPEGTDCDGLYKSCKCVVGSEVESSGNCSPVHERCCFDGSDLTAGNIKCNSSNFSTDWYNYCKSSYGYPDCANIKKTCHNLGAIPWIVSCSSNGGSCISVSVHCFAPDS